MRIEDWKWVSFGEWDDYKHAVFVAPSGKTDVVTFCGHTLHERDRVVEKPDKKALCRKCVSRILMQEWEEETP